MDDYIKVWRKEHARILDIISEVFQLEIFNPAGQMKLQELNRFLEAHVQSEEQNFYPVLRKAAETDPDLRRQLFLFAADMDKIAAEAKAFFQKEESNPLGENIPAEFKKISGMLKSRISREENILMKEYEKVAGKQ